MLPFTQTSIRASARWLLFPVLSFSLVPAAATVTRAQGDPSQSIILERIDQLRTVGELTIRDQWVAAEHVVEELYANRDFTRAWTDPEALEELHRAVLDMRLDGLDPEDYHLAWLPGFDEYVVTKSQDSSDAYGYEDLCIGHFSGRADPLRGARRLIVGDWKEQAAGGGQEHWQDFWRSGLVDEPTARRWAKTVWNKGWVSCY